MKIFVTAKGKTLDSAVDLRFGRAEYYIVYDTETGEFKAEENPFKRGQSGVGISLAQRIIEEDAKAAISGNFGPNAFEVIKAAGIPMYRAKEGQTVKEAVEALLKGELEEMHSATPREVAEKLEMELK